MRLVKDTSTSPYLAVVPTPPLNGGSCMHVARYLGIGHWTYMDSILADSIISEQLSDRHKPATVDLNLFLWQ